MRPISGFERPAVQYAFVGLAIVLIATGVWGGITVRRAAKQNGQLRADLLNARVERDQLEARAAREQSARESLSLQLSRARSRPRADGATPGLTLMPLKTRGSAPPPPTVATLAPSQVIELRLRVPGRPDPRIVTYQAAVRSWSGGQTLWSRAGLKTIEVDRQPLVHAYVTGDVFAPGAYEVLLTGTAADGAQKEIASYEVTVGMIER
jgi:hypothetical protein